VALNVLINDDDFPIGIASCDDDDDDDLDCTKVNPPKVADPVYFFKIELMPCQYSPVLGSTG
jgi:hypothetical protein